ncbi:hypothetical protein [Phenylobacterium kunshanense]|uniref:Nuclease n=1 Tax=Phenylobacterium kunshanense TaxID=1445034 RepID=A0A328B952_9CAUL|nr:hypothetical protein [Phenylobacterium kunshanense]RAK63359.1 hypothetical protein DJ019_16670 [Phenylobacterium kunshanense]
MRLPLLIGALLATSALAGGAQAAVCRGEAPAEATMIRGPVLHVLDGETLCVALGADPSMWVPVRLADDLAKASTAPPARETLMAASFGQDVTCRIVGRDADALLGACEVAAGPVSGLVRKASTVSAGRDWR